MANEVSQISLRVTFEAPPKEAISLVGFLFTCDGRFLQLQPVQNELLVFNTGEAGAGLAVTATAAIGTSAFRVFIAPATDKNIQNVRTIEELENYKPYEPVLKKEATGYSILPISAVISKFWPFCSCRVTGKVSKWSHIGEFWEDRPVCNARVHICDVDAIWYWITRIPDPVIARIPDLILNEVPTIPIPPPLPDPPPFAVVAGPGSNLSSGLSLARAALFSPATQATSLFKTSSPAERRLEFTSKLPELSADIKQVLASGNLDLIRTTIAANFTLFHPWFCYWPWIWPWFYRCQELAIVYTDFNGRFDTTVSFWCDGDAPDIYVWVEYLINGVWTTVYDPPIPCYTWWNYTCGANINIHVTDPRVAVDCCCDCGLPGELVWIRTVGSTSVSHINQASYSQAPPGEAKVYNRIGLTDAPAIYDPWFLPTSPGDFKRPFGGSSTLVVGFGANLPNSSIYYYRWRYKQVMDAGLNPVADKYKALQPIGGSTMKNYEYTYIDSHGDTQIGTNSVKLGPKTVGGNDDLYVIPPEFPNMAPFSVPETSPQWTEFSYANYSISYDSSTLLRGTVPGGDGLYEFELQLFDQAGNLLTGIPKSTFKVPEYNNAGFSVDAPDILLENVVGTAADAYNMLMRIDNSMCQAAIYTVKVNGIPAASDCCGFVPYKPGGVEAVLDLSFEALQPNNFAVFAFGVERGTCGDVTNADANGMVLDSVSGYTRNASSVYDKAFTPAQLLGSCYDDGKGKAAFAETLSVAAMATDGSYRQMGKDSGSVAAFALEP